MANRLVALRQLRGKGRVDLFGRGHLPTYLGPWLARRRRLGCGETAPRIPLQDLTPVVSPLISVGGRRVVPFTPMSRLEGGQCHGSRYRPGGGGYRSGLWVMRRPRCRGAQTRRKCGGKHSQPNMERETAGTDAAQGKARHPGHWPLGPVRWVLIASTSARPHQPLRDERHKAPPFLMRGQVRYRSSSHHGR
jgi:hypothetical protein